MTVISDWANEIMRGLKLPEEDNDKWTSAFSMASRVFQWDITEKQANMILREALMATQDAMHDHRIKTTPLQYMGGVLNKTFETLVKED